MKGKSSMPRTGTNIYKRKDGRWEARYIKGYDYNGKAKYGYVYAKTYKEAKAKQTQCLSNSVQHTADSKNSKTNDTHSLSFWLDRWLELKKVNVKESSFIRYKNNVELHIKPHFASLNVGEITTTMLDDYYSYLLTDGKISGCGGLSSKSVTEIFSLLRSVLLFAQTNNEEIRCAFHRFNSRNSQLKEMRVLSEDEERILVAYLTFDTDLTKLGILLALYTGLRIGELCALQWKDFDFENSTIKIHSTLQRLQKNDPQEPMKTHIIITQPKSYSSYRLIPIPSCLLNTIKSHQNLPNNYLLTGLHSVFVEPRTLQNRFKRILKECNIDNANFHSLRHTFATRCVEAGFDIKSLSEILGHSSVKITLDRYVHSTIEQKRINMDKLKLFN